MQDDLHFNNEYFLNPILDENNVQELQKSFDLRYKNLTQDKSFMIKTGEINNLIYVQVILKNEDRSFYYPVSARMEHNSKLRSKQDTAFFLLDFIEYYFSQYFNDNDILLPISWSDYQCEDEKIQVMGQIFNLDLENRANEILAQIDDIIPHN